MKENIVQNKSDMQFLLANNTKHFKRIATLAKLIWTEHYTTIIGEQQVAYMLDKFQSSSAIEEQVHQGNRYYIILHQEKDVAYFSYNIKNGLLFLSKLYVLKECRGKGFAKKSLAFMEAQAKEFACNKILLTVNKYNTNSIKAYEKMGFKNIEAIVQDIGNGFIMDDYLMEKEIY
ncbi:MAG TPA: GNAT family N-acetyltransferase [Flavobacteriaceae bacterium]|nr:GNAT family N-acetyltransferase [Flavobacteriaceae bacterium]